MSLLSLLGLPGLPQAPSDFPAKASFDLIYDEAFTCSSVLPARQITIVA